MFAVRRELEIGYLRTSHSPFFPHQHLRRLEAEVFFFPLLFASFSISAAFFLFGNIMNTLSTHTHPNIVRSKARRRRPAVTDAGGKFVIKSSRQRRKGTLAGPQHGVVFVQVKFLRSSSSSVPTDWPLLLSSLAQTRVVTVYHRAV